MGLFSNFNKKKKKKLDDLNHLPKINMGKIIGGKKKKNSPSCGDIIPQ